jgi:hypothetical protein
MGGWLVGKKVDGCSLEVDLSLVKIKKESTVVSYILVPHFVKALRNLFLNCKKLIPTTGCPWLISTVHHFFKARY